MAKISGSPASSSPSRPAVVSEKERNAFLNARLAKEVLNADGILSTKIGGGAVDTDLMMTYTRAEEMGMKAALIIMERYPDTGITFVPENVNALVTPGLTRDPITLPAVDRVIGGETLHLDNSNPDNTNPGLRAAAGEPGNHRLDGRPGRRHQSNRRVAADDVHELRKFETRNPKHNPNVHKYRKLLNLARFGF